MIAPAGRFWIAVCNGCERESQRGYPSRQIAARQVPVNWKTVRVLGAEEHYCGACQRKGA